MVCIYKFLKIRRYFGGILKVEIDENTILVADIKIFTQFKIKKEK